MTRFRRPVGDLNHRFCKEKTVFSRMPAERMGGSPALVGTAIFIPEVDLPAWSRARRLTIHQWGAPVGRS